MKRLESWEAVEKLLAGDFKGTSEYNLFIYRFIHDMENKYGLNIRISEAEKIYEFFHDIISYKLDPISEEQIGLYDERPEEPVPVPEPDDPGMTNPDYTPGKPSHNDPETDPLTEALAKSIGPYKGYDSGYVSGSNVEPEDVLWIEDTWLAESSPLPNGARHFEKWSEEAKKQSTCSEFQCQMDEVKKAVEKRAKSIDFFMRDFDLSESEAETVYYYLTEKDANSKGKPPIDENVKDVLDHIKELTDIVNDL